MKRNRRRTAAAALPFAFFLLASLALPAQATGQTPHPKKTTTVSQKKNTRTATHTIKAQSSKKTKSQAKATSSRRRASGRAASPAVAAGRRNMVAMAIKAELASMTGQGEAVQPLVLPGWEKFATALPQVVEAPETQVTLLDKELSPHDPPGPAEESDGAQSVIEYARNYLGTPYHYGGAGPGGFDCSGFTRYVYASRGISLRRSSYDQANDGREVSLSELRPGDLLFFDTGRRRQGGISHVGMYIGEGKFIHAGSQKGNRRVKIDNLSAGYYMSRFVTARRILNDASAELGEK